jgi:phosphoribosylformylglycinamidine cyclo-ligase
LKPEEIESVVGSMAEACEETGVSLVGGEMAEMPGVYTDGEIDVIGCVTGVVEKDKIITGKNIKPGDLVFGFGSSGLHTNGFSLARKVLFEIGGYDVWDKFPEMEKNLGETLLEPHINYTNPILDILDRGIEIKGLSHITGGGFIENIPRILPAGCGVEIQRYSFPVPPIFELIQKVGEVEDREMYKTLNMGIGMVMVIAESEKSKVIEAVKEHPNFTLYEIGKVVEDNRGAVNVV